MKIRGVSIYDSFPISSGTVDSTPLPDRVILPLVTPWGEASPMVQVGEEVKRGQCIAKGDDVRVPPVLASISGTIEEIKSNSGFRGTEVLSVVIRSDGKDESISSSGANLGDNPDRILEKIWTAGIREVDSYSWPLALRIAKPELAVMFELPDEALDRPIETLILNAMDRQPWVSVRHVAIERYYKEFLESIPLLQQVTGAGRTVLAIPAGKVLAEDFERDLKECRVDVVFCPNKYPAALEPLLVQYVTKKQVPQPEGDSRKVGAVVVDVITAMHVLKAVRDETPLMGTMVDVMVPRQGITQVMEVRTGMVVEELLNYFRPEPHNAVKAVLGGPFLGYAQHNLQVPVTPEVDSLIFQDKGEISRYANLPCINCGNCVHLCPMRLLPNELGKCCEYNAFEEAERKYLFHCIECGICAFVCPSKRSMVQLLRFGKQELLAMRMES
jgi:electron transport complex protein RnfC